jgi:putative spermidine/putrescine transport system ATP-binding protein
VLLLDEPLSNLDAQLREAMLFELRRIQRKLGTTTIMVTHDQAEALSIADRVVVMEAGRATQVDRPEQLYEHPASRFISGFVGKTNWLAARVLGPGRAQLADGTAVALPQAGGAGSGTEVLVCVRPEKIRLAPSEAAGRLAGTVTERFFLGSQWLYRVHTAVGELEVSCANDGRAPWPEQAAVRLDWSDDVARVVAA